MSVKLMNCTRRVRVECPGPGAWGQGFPPRETEEHTRWPGPFTILERRRSPGRTGESSAEGYQRLSPSLWKVQSDCTMTLKLVFQVVSYNFGLGRQKGGDRVSL